jgi:hypothetical protein
LELKNPLMFRRCHLPFLPILKLSSPPPSSLLDANAYRSTVDPDDLMYKESLRALLFSEAALPSPVVPGLAPIVPAGETLEGLNPQAQAFLNARWPSWNAEWPSDIVPAAEDKEAKKEEGEELAAVATPVPAAFSPGGQPSGVSKLRINIDPEPPARRAGSPSRQARKVEAFDKIEFGFINLLMDEDELAALIGPLVKEGMVRMMDLYRWVVERYPIADNSYAVRHAYRQTCGIDPGEGEDTTMEFAHSKNMLANIMYFNRLFYVCNKDADSDLVTWFEFKKAIRLMRMLMSERDARSAFNKMDTKEQGAIIMSDIAVWIATGVVPSNDAGDKDSAEEGGSEAPATAPENDKVKSRSRAPGPASRSSSVSRSASPSRDRSNSNSSARQDTFDALEFSFINMLVGEETIAAVMSEFAAMVNDEGTTAIADVDKWVVARFPLLSNQSALLRAFMVTAGVIVDYDSRVVVSDVKILLANIMYFNRLYFVCCKEHDSDRLSWFEFKKGIRMMRLLMSEKESREAFTKFETLQDNAVVMGEFCTWMPNRSRSPSRQRPASPNRERAASPPPRPSVSLAKKLASVPTALPRVAHLAAAPAQPAPNPHIRPAVSPRKLLTLPQKALPRVAMMAPVSLLSAANGFVNQTHAKAQGVGRKPAPSGPKPPSKQDLFDAMEASFIAFLKDLAQLKAVQMALLSASVSGRITVSAVDDWVQSKYPQLNSRPALGRAFVQVTGSTGLERGSTIEVKDVKPLLAGIM